MRLLSAAEVLAAIPDHQLAETVAYLPPARAVAVMHAVLIRIAALGSDMESALRAYEIGEDVEEFFADCVGLPRRTW